MLHQNAKYDFYIKLFFSLLICVGGGWLTGIITEESVKTWYPTLQKPAWTPPNIVFPIVWTALYTLMAISLALVWSSDKKNKKYPLGLFAIQLFLNFIWSGLFFYFRSPGLALLDLILLWFAILLTISFFWLYSKTAAYLLIPYLAWVNFAFFLNYYIWSHN
jgi:benzodiazapine receptor